MWGFSIDRAGSFDGHEPVHSDLQDISVGQNGIIHPFACEVRSVQRIEVGRRIETAAAAESDEIILHSVVVSVRQAEATRHGFPTRAEPELLVDIPPPAWPPASAAAR